MEKVYQQRERENETETFSPVCQGVGFVSHLCLQDTKQSSWHLKRKCLPILPEILEFWSRKEPRASRGKLPAQLRESAASWCGLGSQAGGACMSSPASLWPASAACILGWEEALKGRVVRTHHHISFEGSQLQPERTYVNKKAAAVRIRDDLTN